jgi:hypothetical protein
MDTVSSSRIMSLTAHERLCSIQARPHRRRPTINPT